jgi:hypothetical protein
VESARAICSLAHTGNEMNHMIQQHEHQPRSPSSPRSHQRRAPAHPGRTLAPYFQTYASLKVGGTSESMAQTLNARCVEPDAECKGIGQMATYNYRRRIRILTHGAQSYCDIE